MSRLETTVQPTLRRLWNGASSLADLATEDQIALAAWAAKVGYCEFSATRFADHIPPNHRVHLKDTQRLSPEVVVVATLADLNQQWATYCSCQWEVVGRWSGSEKDQIGKAAYKLALLVGNVQFLTCFHPLPGHHLAFTTGLHFPLTHPAKNFLWLTPLFDMAQALGVDDYQQLYSRNAWLVKEEFLPRSAPSVMETSRGLRWRVDALPAIS